MLNILFTETANNLRSFLQNVLPGMTADWWKKFVVSALSFQQQRRVEENKINNLSGLDLVGLLRVLDKNWYDNKLATFTKIPKNLFATVSLTCSFQGRPSVSIPPSFSLMEGL